MLGFLGFFIILYNKTRRVIRNLTLINLLLSDTKKHHRFLGSAFSKTNVVAIQFLYLREDICKSFGGKACFRSNKDTLQPQPHMPSNAVH